LGAGKIGSAIASRLVQKNVFPAKDVLVTGRCEEKLEKLRALGIEIGRDNKTAAEESDVVVISVKPKDVAGLCTNLGDACADSSKLVISVAAGIKISAIAGLLQKPDGRIIRAMPNIGVLVGEGFTALAPGTDCLNRDDALVAAKIFCNLGTCGFYDERMINPLTGISGSMPAYLAAFAGVIISTAIRHGIRRNEGRTIAGQNMVAMGKLLLETDYSVRDMIRFVGTKGGTTHAGKELAKKLGLFSAFRQTIERAIERAYELGHEDYGK